VTVGVLCVALFASVVSSWQGSRQIRDTLVEQGERIAESLASNSSLALLYASADNASEAGERDARLPDVTEVAIHNTVGRALISRGKNRSVKPSAAVAVPPPRRPDRSRDRRLVGLRGAVRTKTVASPFDMVERAE